MSDLNSIYMTIKVILVNLYKILVVEKNLTFW